jgi:hypothetical protein
MAEIIYDFTDNDQGWTLNDNFEHDPIEGAISAVGAEFGSEMWYDPQLPVDVGSYFHLQARFVSTTPVTCGFLVTSYTGGGYEEFVDYRDVDGDTGYINFYWPFGVLSEFLESQVIQFNVLSGFSGNVTCYIKRVVLNTYPPAAPDYSNIWPGGIGIRDLAPELDPFSQLLLGTNIASPVMAIIAHYDANYEFVDHTGDLDVDSDDHDTVQQEAELNGATYAAAKFKSQYANIRQVAWI